MWEDEIVAEVRRVREAQAAQYKYDLRAIYAFLKKAEEQSDRLKVSFLPKRIAEKEGVGLVVLGEK